LHVPGHGLQVSGHALRVAGHDVEVSGRALYVSVHMLRVSGSVLYVSGSTLYVSGPPLTLSGRDLRAAGNVLSWMQDGWSPPQGGCTLAHLHKTRIENRKPSSQPVCIFYQLFASGERSYSLSREHRERD